MRSARARSRGYAHLVVLDTHLDPLWRDNPFVRGEPRIRFYAGVPLYLDGQPIGTFCVADTAPRTDFSEIERQLLLRYAAIAGAMLELRSLRVQDGRERTRFRRLSETSPDAMLITDGRGHILHWNAGAEHLFGYRAEEARSLGMLDLLVESDRPAEGFPAWVGGALGQIRESDVRLRDGRVRPLEISVSRWLEDGEVFHGAVLRDLTGHREKEAALHRLAHRDGLTGLPNRAAMRARMEAARRDGALAVLLVDLDGFKDVNDTIGHAAGDEVLREAASRICAGVREADTVARIGGDEFVVILPGCGDSAVAADVADRIVAAMEEPFSVQSGRCGSGRASASPWPRPRPRPSTTCCSARISPSTRPRRMAGTGSGSTRPRCGRRSPSGSASSTSFTAPSSARSSCCTISRRCACATGHWWAPRP